MKIYDNQIVKALSLLEKEVGKGIKKDISLWEDVGKQNLVLRQEMAYELGGGNLPAVSFLGVTSSEKLVPHDSAILYGEDLSQISKDTPYARIILIRINDELFEEDESLYDIIRELNNIRYKVNPKGFMSRISTRSNHEPVRVSKEALNEGLKFDKVAKLFLDAYKKNNFVISAQIIFITLKGFNYSELNNLSQKNNEITTALDHILRDVKMDCSSCKLKSICNEVEGMKKTHFK